MKHLKKYDEQINEYFGIETKDLMNPRIDQLINYLNNLKNDINTPNKFYNTEDVIKVEHMWNYLIHNIDLDTLASDSRKNAHKTKQG